MLAYSTNVISDYRASGWIKRLLDIARRIDGIRFSSSNIKENEEAESKPTRRQNNL